MCSFAFLKNLCENIYNCFHRKIHITIYQKFGTPRLLSKIHYIEFYTVEEKVFRVLNTQMHNTTNANQKECYETDLKQIISKSEAVCKI